MVVNHQGDCFVKKIKQLTAMSILGVSLAIAASPAAYAATPYEQVMATAQHAAKLALAKNLKGPAASCYIATRARVTAKKVGYKEKTPEFRSVIARTTHQSALAARSAKGLKIPGLLKRSVVVDCEAVRAPFFAKAAGAAAGGGSGISLPVVGGAVLGVAALAALASSGGGGGDNTPDASTRPPSPE